MSNEVLKATVKATGKKIQVYKLRDGRYNRFLGDSLSIDKLEGKEHLETFEEKELEFKKTKAA